MEDAQPNETRLSRKGSTAIPRVWTTRPHRSQSFSLSHDSRPSKRAKWQSPLPRLPNSRTEKAPGQVLLEVRLPPECHLGVPGCHNARKRWIHNQKCHLRINRHLSVVLFEYLDHHRAVLFTCRTLQASQSTGHHARENIGTGINARPDRDSISIVRPLDKHGGLAQNNELGPSQTRPSPRALARPQRLDMRSSVPTSCYPVERMPVQSPTMEIESPRVQTVHPSSVQRGAVAHIAPSAIIDLILDPLDTVAEGNSARWSTFRSGRVDVCLPPLSNGPRNFSSEKSTDPRPSIDQTPTEAIGQHEDVCGRDTNLLSAQPSIRAKNTTPVRPMEDHRIGGSLSDRLRQHDGPEVAGSNCAYDSPVVLDDETVIPSSSNCNPLVRGFISECANLALSLGPHDKPRRVLHHSGFTCVITAHGIIDQVEATSVLKWGRNIRSPSLPYKEFVDDACMLSHQGEPIIVLGHAREQHQIAFLKHGQVSQHVTLRRDWNTTKRPGASAMTSLMSPLKFACGGYDHRVHIWDIAQDLSGASAAELAIRHTSLVHSLLPIVDTSHKLISVGADRDIHIYDMSAEHVVRTLRTSCTPYHAHKTDSQFSTLLEVAHLETQFEVRDRRVPNQAVQRFGFITEERRGRYEKADTWSHFVVCGDRNGAVRLWDLRNVSTEVALQQCFGDPVVQVINTGSRLLACSKKNELAYLNFQGE